MADLILRVRRGGHLLGSWSLGEDPLDFQIIDMVSGREVAHFSALGDVGALTEGPQRPARLDGDDLTMPLPEPTDYGEPTDGGEPTDDGGAIPERPTPVPNLALGLPLGGGPSTMPPPEGVEATQELSLDRSESVELSLDRSESMELSLDEVVELRPRETTEVTLGEPIASTEELPREDDPPTDISHTPPEGPGVDLDTLVRGSPTPPAEVWVRRDDEWHPAGQLVPGQRVLSLGGWVRLTEDGRVVVRAGPRLEGSATLVDGRTVALSRGDESITLPAGASIVLRSGPGGMYIRSEPLPAGHRAYSLSSSSR